MECVCVIIFVDKRSHRRSSTAAENDYIVKGEIELETLNGFLMKKVADMNKPDPDKKNDSGADVTFKHALHKYHGTLLMSCANASITVRCIHAHFYSKSSNRHYE